MPSIRARTGAASAAAPGQAGGKRTIRKTKLNNTDVQYHTKSKNIEDKIEQYRPTIPNKIKQY
jgi:hypothetical protein